MSNVVWLRAQSRFEAPRIEIFKEQGHVIPGWCWLQLCTLSLKLFPSPAWCTVLTPRCLKLTPFIIDIPWLLSCNISCNICNTACKIWAVAVTRLSLWAEWGLRGWSTAHLLQTRPHILTRTFKDSRFVIVGIEPWQNLYAFVRQTLIFTYIYIEYWRQ